MLGILICSLKYDMIFKIFNISKFNNSYLKFNNNFKSHVTLLYRPKYDSYEKKTI